MKDWRAIDDNTRKELISQLNFDLNVILTGQDRSDIIRALSGAIDALGTLAVNACVKLDVLETDDYIMAKILK